MFKVQFFWVLGYFVVLSACQNEQKNQAETITPTDTLVVTSDTVSVDTVVAEQTIVPPEDGWLNRALVVLDSFPQFSIKFEDTLEVIKDPFQHWFIQNVEKGRQMYLNNNSRRIRTLPDSNAIRQISEIHRFVLYYPRVNAEEIMLERWIFKDKKYAESWRYGLSNVLKDNFYTKPPREEWTSGDTLYLVATRSAAQWFEMGQDIIKILSSKNRSQLRTFYDPLDLKEFKKKHGAHSGPFLDHEYLVKPVNTYYFNYFLFQAHKLLKDPRTRTSEFVGDEEFRMIVYLTGKPTGEENYLKIKDKLAELQCTVAANDLENLDLVGLEQSVVVEKLGDAIHQQGDLQVYGLHDRVIVVQYQENIVAGFKYMWLDDSWNNIVQGNSERVKQILEFTGR